MHIRRHDVRALRLVLLAAVVAGASFALPARAQTGGAGGNGSASALAAGDFLMRLDRITDEKHSTPLTDYEQARFFNQARCQCGVSFRLIVDFSTTGVQKKPSLSSSPRGEIRVIAGTPECVSPEATARSQAYDSHKCRELYKVPLPNFASPGAPRTELDIRISDMLSPAGDCSDSYQKSYIYLWVDADGDQIPDLSTAPNVTINYDGKPPATPTGITVRPGNEALQVSWAGIGSLADLAGYVVFCSRGGDLSVYGREHSGFKNQYMTQSTLDSQEKCPATAPPTEKKSAALAYATVVGAGGSGGAGGASGAGGTGGVGGASGGAGGSGGTGDTVNNDPALGIGPLQPTDPFNKHDRDFLCSGLITTDTSARLEGLQNGIPYLVGVASVDLAGNVSNIQGVYMQSPLSTFDFYSGYRELGGKAEGGYCAFGAARTRGVGLAGLLLIAGAAIVWRRRRR